MLLYNSQLRFFPGKLKSKWSGPFMVKEVKPSGVVELINPTTSNLEKTWIINGQRLKIYNGSDIERLTTVIHLQDP